MNRKIFAALFLIFCSILLPIPFFCEDWIIAGIPFSQKQSRGSESAKKTAEILPQLILEQLSNKSERVIPDGELLDRALYELQTERISLFMQLSKEVKARDSLVLEKTSPRALEKSIVQAEKKIAEIEEKIAKNLEQAEKEKEKYGAVEPPKKEESAFKKIGKFLPIPFFRRNAETKKIVRENVRLYKNDSSALFKPKDEILKEGISSRAFEKEVLNAKIRGVISGAVSVYGEYAGVTVDLTVFPGAIKAGSVTEVGVVGDIVPLARRIVRNLMPKIANSLPISIEFDIRSAQSGEKIDAQITMDGVVLKDFGEGVLADAGIHTLSVESSGFETAVLSYSFAGENRFLVKANLVPKISGVMNVRLKKFRDGLFCADGIDSSPNSKGDGWAHLSVNGKNVLAVFEDSRTKEKAFVVFPAEIAADGANLVANAKPFDRAANIDKRRRRMYIAYSALLCSLPFTFYSLGEFTAANNAYSQGRESKSEALSWQTKSNVTQAISFVCAGWFVIELVRYLWAADGVLPAKAKIESPPKKAKIELDESAVLQMNVYAEFDRKIEDSETNPQ